MNSQSHASLWDLCNARQRAGTEVCPKEPQRMRTPIKRPTYWTRLGAAFTIMRHRNGLMTAGALCSAR